MSVLCAVGARGLYEVHLEVKMQLYANCSISSSFENHTFDKLSLEDAEDLTVWRILQPDLMPRNCCVWTFPVALSNSTERLIWNQEDSCIFSCNRGLLWRALRSQSCGDVGHWILFQWAHLLTVARETRWTVPLWRCSVLSPLDPYTLGTCLFNSIIFCFRPSQDMRPHPTWLTLESTTIWWPDTCSLQWDLKACV